VSLCETAGISPPVIRGRQLGDPRAIELLRRLDLDFMVCVHFPYLLRRPILDGGTGGVLNLHPSYLPYNRGWHTPTWALLDGTPAGATLHYMDEALDTGDIVCQRRRSSTRPTPRTRCTGSSRRSRSRCSGRAGSASGAVYAPACRRRPARPRFIVVRPCSIPPSSASIWTRTVRAADLLRRLRALTTDRLDEAAYFESGGRKYRVQVTIVPDAGGGRSAHPAAPMAAKGAEPV
jgi:hypothetical protein